MPDNNLNDTVGGNNLSTFSLRSPLKSELNLRSKETQRDDQFPKIAPSPSLILVTGHHIPVGSALHGLW